jgi:hypothetical protein
MFLFAWAYSLPPFHFFLELLGRRNDPQGVFFAWRIVYSAPFFVKILFLSRKGREEQETQVIKGSPKEWRRLPIHPSQ